MESEFIYDLTDSEKALNSVSRFLNIGREKISIY